MKLNRIIARLDINNEFVVKGKFLEGHIQAAGGGEAYQREGDRRRHKINRINLNLISYPNAMLPAIMAQ